jgi:hypothetical protein
MVLYSLATNISVHVVDGGYGNLPMAEDLSKLAISAIARAVIRKPDTAGIGCS